MRQFRSIQRRFRHRTLAVTCSLLVLGSGALLASASREPIPCPSIITPQTLGYDGFIEYRDEDFRVLALGRLDSYQLSGWDAYFLGFYETIPDEPQNVYYTKKWVQAIVETHCSRELRQEPTGGWRWYTVVREVYKRGVVMPLLGASSPGGGADRATDDTWYESHGGIQYLCYNASLEDGSRVMHCDAV